MGRINYKTHIKILPARFIKILPARFSLVDFQGRESKQPSPSFLTVHSWECRVFTVSVPQCSLGRGWWAAVQALGNPASFQDTIKCHGKGPENILGTKLSFSEDWCPRPALHGILLRCGFSWGVQLWPLHTHGFCKHGIFNILGFSKMVSKDSLTP